MAPSTRDPEAAPYGRPADELLFNRGLVATARDRHRYMADTLARLVARHARPDNGIWTNGMWIPAVSTSTAWQAARETGAFEDIPLATVLGVDVDVANRETRLLTPYDSALARLARAR